MAQSTKTGRKKRSPARGGPMQITASSGYAIHGLAYLANKGEDAVVFLSEISDYFSIPSSYLAKVFQTLARAGIVTSYRGAKGGYALARPAEEITLREVIETFEGPILNTCSLMAGPCTMQFLCGVYKRLAEAQRAFLEVLDTHTIRSIADEFGRLDAAGVKIDGLMHPPCD